MINQSEVWVGRLLLGFCWASEQVVLCCSYIVSGECVLWLVGSSGWFDHARCAVVGLGPQLAEHQPQWNQSWGFCHSGRQMYAISPGECVCVSGKGSQWRLPIFPTPAMTLNEPNRLCLFEKFDAPSDYAALLCVTFLRNLPEHARHSQSTLCGFRIEETKGSAPLVRSCCY